MAAPPPATLCSHRLSAPAEPRGPAVVGVHGITANGLIWAPVASGVEKRLGQEMWAPDLAGRGGSRDLGGPFGLTRHAHDILDFAAGVSAEPVVLVGHSMGALVAARAAQLAPDAVAGLVLVDGGFAIGARPAQDVEDALAELLGPAMARLRMAFEDLDRYIAFWAAHPGMKVLAGGLHRDAVVEYLRHDLVEAPSRGWVSACRMDAVLADGEEMLHGETSDVAAREAVEAGTPAEFIWADRGFFGDSHSLYDRKKLRILAIPKQVRVTAINDLNHYSLLWDVEGVCAIVDAIERVGRRSTANEAQMSRKV